MLALDTGEYEGFSVLLFDGGIFFASTSGGLVWGCVSCFSCSYRYSRLPNSFLGIGMRETAVLDVCWRGVLLVSNTLRR